MCRIIFILLFVGPSLFAQGVSIGLHGCMAWSKFEVETEEYTISFNDAELFYGAGVDISIKPPASPLGVEGGFTYLIRNEEEAEIEYKYGAHPAYINAKFFIMPMVYLGGGLNYTFWKIEAGGEKLDDLSGGIGFQIGGGVEMGVSSLKLYGSAYYMIQNGKWEPEGDSEVDVKSKSFQIRAGIRFGG